MGVGLTVRGWQNSERNLAGHENGAKLWELSEVAQLPKPEAGLPEGSGWAG